LQADLALVEHSTVGSEFNHDSLAIINPLTSLTLTLPGRIPAFHPVEMIRSFILTVWRSCSLRCRLNRLR